jgi:hypothetical protein
VLVNNAGIFITKTFTDYTAEDFKSVDFGEVTERPKVRHLSQDQASAFKRPTASCSSSAGLMER